MNLLKELYGISAQTHQEKDMIAFVSTKLSELGVTFEVDEAGNIYATKGKSGTYPCLAAHLDEVHPLREEGYETICVRDEFIMGFNSGKREFNGIGADDKNGIWVCLKCLEKYENLKCIFFVGEEQGCIGSRQADMKFFDDCRFVIQCDRKGNSDFISNIYGNPLCSTEFINAASLERNGYKETEGMQTDVQTLRQRGLEISCANISCGYYYPHTPHEMTNIADLEKCLTFVQHIVENCREVYTYKYERPQRRDFMSDYSSSFFATRKQDTEVSTDSPQRLHDRQYSTALDRMTSFFCLNPRGSLSVFLRIYADNFSRLTKADYDNIYKEVTGDMPPVAQKRKAHPMYKSRPKKFYPRKGVRCNY